jgi:hypothetical protein
MNSAANFQYTHPELYLVPPIGVAPTKNVTPPLSKVAPFTLEPPSERPPVGFVPSQNIDTTPTLDGMVFPVDDKTMPTYQTLNPASYVLTENPLVGDLRPLLDRESRVDEVGREITYQFDPISGLYLHQGYAKNETERPLHYAKILDRGDHFIPPAIHNTGNAIYTQTQSAPTYFPRYQPYVSALH